jgi:hypothetical protein
LYSCALNVVSLSLSLPFFFSLCLACEHNIHHINPSCSTQTVSETSDSNCIST